MKTFLSLGPLSSARARAWETVLKMMELKQSRVLSTTLSLIGLMFFGSCAGGTGMNTGTSGGDVEFLKTKVIAQYPHDTWAFTQGLLWYDGFLYESTGRYGQSVLRRLELESGKSLQSKSLALRYFGEGLVQVGEKLYQLTWQSGVAFEYDLHTFSELRRFQYEGEGWGITSDGEAFIMSDGSDSLQWRDLETFELQKRVTVSLNGRTISKLNELEYVDGFVFANIWGAREIVKIDPSSGNVVAVIDTSALPYRTRFEGEDVLNGIAYKPETGTFLLTGKLWPAIYEVRFE